MALMPAALRVASENIAVGDVRVAIGAKGADRRNIAAWSESPSLQADFRCLAADRSAGERAATVGNYLIDIRVELRAAARHPHMQREHIVVLPGQDLVAGLDDQ